MISNKEKNFISIVIYIHNNEKNIENYLLKINNTIKGKFDKYEIICVNDASTDKSVEKIKNATKKMPETIVSIINMSYYHGIEASMNAGVDLSIGDFVYEFDIAYIDYDLNLIIEVYNKALEGYDIVSVTSDSKQYLMSRLFYKIFNNNSNSIYKIKTETFRILSRRAINRIKSMNKSIPYRKAIYANCGLNTVNIKYNAKYRTKQYFSKEEKKERKKLAMDSMVLFTDFSYKFAIAMSIIMMLATIITAAYTVFIFISGRPIEGWTTTMLLLAFSFFGIFAILTIAIKYLSIIIKIVFQKQDYLIESIEKCR